MSYNQQTSLFLSHFYLVSLFQEQRYHTKGLVSLFVCFGLFFSLFLRDGVEFGYIMITIKGNFLWEISF